MTDAPPSPTEVAVIIVSWNTRDLLADSIVSALAAEGEESVRVYVVDNASADGSAEMVARRFPGAVLIRNTDNVGFGRANNQGFQASSEPFVLLLNSDAELRPGALSAMLRALEADPRSGAVGACLLFPDGRFQASYNAFPSLVSDGMALVGLARFVYGPRYPSYPEDRSLTPREVDWVGGACMLLRRTALDGIGGFDPDYHMYSEEMDLCRRILDAGWAVRFCPEATAIHHGGQSTRQRPSEQPRLLWESRLLYYRKHHSAWQAATLSAMIRLAYLCRSVAWGLRGYASRPSVRPFWMARARAAWSLAAHL